MLDATKNGIKKIYSILTAVWSVFVGVLFVIQVWRIFAIGKQPFTTANISEKFSQIAIPVYIGLALVIGSLVLSLVLPEPSLQAKTFFLSSSTTLKRLKKRLPKQNETDVESWQAVYTWKVRNVISWSVCSVVGALCLSVAIAYIMGGFAPVAQKGFFAEHRTAEYILRAMPWVCGMLGTGIFAVYFHTFAQNKQIALMKTLIADAVRRGEKAVPALENVKKKNVFAFTQSVWFLPVVRGIVGAVAVTLIIVGICNGGMGAVLSKAITVCTQCIGLG